MSLFITFEGIEGAGKSTQILLLKSALLKQGLNVLITREPGGTFIGDQIRTILLDQKNKDMTPLTELFLYEASRAQHVHEKILPALKQKKIVISDRFYDASTVYQGMARELPLSWIHPLNRMASFELKPDLTFVLDVDVTKGLSRIQKRYRSTKKKDRIERESQKFHHKIRQGYLTLAKKEPSRIKVIDAAQDINTIHQNILYWVNKKR
ncbi:MAG: dTMP kinase [Deltaproteobacteria bacterium]|nr:dTMP kinase [Deltaproteobacteria bacterium]